MRKLQLRIKIQYQSESMIKEIFNKTKVRPKRANKVHCKKVLRKITAITVGDFEIHYNRCKIFAVYK